MTRPTPEGRGASARSPRREPLYACSAASLHPSGRRSLRDQSKPAARIDTEPALNAAFETEAVFDSLLDWTGATNGRFFGLRLINLADSTIVNVASDSHGLDGFYLG